MTNPLFPSCCCFGPHLKVTWQRTLSAPPLTCPHPLPQESRGGLCPQLQPSFILFLKNRRQADPSQLRSLSEPFLPPSLSKIAPLPQIPPPISPGSLLSLWSLLHQGAVLWPLGRGIKLPSFLTCSEFPHASPLTRGSHLLADSWYQRLSLVGCSGMQFQQKLQSLEITTGIAGKPNEIFQEGEQLLGKFIHSFILHSLPEHVCCPPGESMHTEFLQFQSSDSKHYRGSEMAPIIKCKNFKQRKEYYLQLQCPKLNSLWKPHWGNWACSIGPHRQLPQLGIFLGNLNINLSLTLSVHSQMKRQF